MVPIVKTWFKFLSPKVGGLGPKKPKTMNLKKVGWKNWALMIQTNTKVNWNDKRMKIDEFMLKKNVLGRIQGAQLFYIALRFDYKIGSWLLQYFPLNFSILFPWWVPSII